NVYGGLPELLPLIDILIGSKEFPQRVTGIADEHAALVELKVRYGCAVVGMTIGAEGAVVYCEGSFIESPGFEARGGCRDTTGAGDAFRGGFLYGLLTGEDIETSLQLGNAVAAIKCSALGARTALPTKVELEEFLAQSRKVAK
ncbi:MAG TPA: carbohydrate kinase family protein, partial [Pyrinomonadaceae bacterium]|nr:carbohydrate kinase family protein [Pyrinomonadaceae bacterium]